MKLLQTLAVSPHQEVSSLQVLPTHNKDRLLLLPLHSMLKAPHILVEPLLLIKDSLSNSSKASSIKEAFRVLLLLLASAGSRMLNQLLLLPKHK